jgi:hypothetical protein
MVLSFDYSIPRKKTCFEINKMSNAVFRLASSDSEPQPTGEYVILYGNVSRNFFKSRHY